MPQILVRNLEEETVSLLKERAQLNRRSLQSEVQIILEKAARVTDGAFWDQAARIRTHLKYQPGEFSDSTNMVREDRDA